jgi:TonB family protein
MLLAASSSGAGPSKAVPIDPTSWVNSGDYPESAIRARQQGTVSYQVEIDPTGAARGCRVTGSSGSAALDEVTCRIIKERARFEPARDLSGDRVASTWASQMRWALPNAMLTRPEGGLGFNLFTLELAPDGRVLSCSEATEDDAVDCGLNTEPQPWIAPLASKYRTLRLQIGMEMLPSGPPPPGPDWGKLIARRLSVMTFPTEGRYMSACRVTASEGEPLFSPDTCASNQIHPGPTGGPVTEMIDGWALYGVPR